MACMLLNAQHTHSRTRTCTQARTCLYAIERLLSPPTPHTYTHTQSSTHRHVALPPPPTHTPQARTCLNTTMRFPSQRAADLAAPAPIAAASLRVQQRGITPYPAELKAGVRGVAATINTVKAAQRPRPATAT